MGLIKRIRKTIYGMKASGDTYSKKIILHLNITMFL